MTPEEIESIEVPEGFKPLGKFTIYQTGEHLLRLVCGCESINDALVPCSEHNS